EKSGLSKGSLYWYFKSKDEILLGIFERIFSREFVELEKLTGVDGTASECLSLFTDIVIQDVNRMLRLMPIAYEFLSLAFRRKIFQDAFKIYINKYMDIMLPIIQQGIDSGEFRDISALEVGIAIGSIIEGTILLWVYDKNLVNPETHIRSGINLLLSGIKTR
ncbi:MAG: TetR/AcrR family transcriptional regulator, partial [Anaerolineales bacterium]